MTNKRDKSSTGVKALFSSAAREEEAPKREEHVNEAVETEKPQPDVPVESVSTSPEPKVRRGRPSSQSNAPPQELATEYLKIHLTKTERARMDAFVSSRYSPVKGYSELCRLAIAAFLDREEPILKEAEKAVERARRRI